MRRKLLAILACLPMALFGGDDASLTRHKLEPGICVWDAPRAHHEDYLHKSLQLVDHEGFHAVRLLLSPVSQRTYALPPSACSDGRRSLRCLLLSEPYRRALEVKTVDTVMFTAYDFASYARQHYLDPEFLQAHRQQVFEEYRDLAEAIMKAWSGSGRVFIISHWEGDNQVYCGSSYEFQTIDDKRYACLYHDPERRLQGITEWLKIRQEAISEGRRRGVAAGAANVEVYHAAEFNTIFATRRVAGASIRSKDFKGILDAVIPAVHPDLCSYSAWESVNRNRLTKDLRELVKACAPAPLIVGEIGFKDNPDKRYVKAVAALQPLRDSIPFVFFWQAFEPAAGMDPGFGLFDADGKALHRGALEAIRRLQP